MAIEQGWALIKHRWKDVRLNVVFENYVVDYLRHNHNISESEVLVSGLAHRVEAEAILKLMPVKQRAQIRSALHDSE